MMSALITGEANAGGAASGCEFCGVTGVYDIDLDSDAVYIAGFGFLEGIS